MRKTDDKSFDEVISVLPERIRSRLEYISDSVKHDTYEIRIRKDRPVVLFGKYGSAFVCENSVVSSINKDAGIIVTSREISDTVSGVCGYSVYSHQRDIALGFVSFGNGHRAGFCGTAVTDNETTVTIRNITSVNLRIARDFPNSSDALLDKIYKDGVFSSVLLAGAPCSGKTTVLKSLAYKLSSFYKYGFMKTVLIDERGEMGSDIGVNCDVLIGYPKNIGISQAVSVLSPEVIICDEISTDDEADRVIKCINSGVSFALSVHASNKRELFTRPLARRLIESGGFKYIAILKNPEAPGELSEIISTEDINYEYGRNNNGSGKLVYSGIPYNQI